MYSAGLTYDFVTSAYRPRAVQHCVNSILDLFGNLSSPLHIRTSNFAAMCLVDGDVYEINVK